ncbi:MAG: TrbG/VirB9 family P-type conjugative transfer protein [Helicobacter sp.]|nr:TrbG/VirB9 family P-type conjugative transfer protein [Helicobacter sp.]
MKKIICLLLAGTFAFAEPNPFVDEDNSVFSDSDFEVEQVANNEHNSKMMFLDSVQKHFWNPKRKPQDNTLNILHRDGDTHKIRTRYAMVTTIIFDDDKIAKVIFGDPNGFELTELGKDKWDLSNIITIKPKMIGIDTNLTIIGESGTIYTFYVFSTHFTNRRDPAFSVFVSKDRSIGKIAMTNLEDESKKAKKDTYKKIEYDAIEEDDGEFISIGDRVNKLHIEKSKISRGYIQSPKTTRSWKQLWLKKNVSPQATRMMAIDIFNDNDYTYFKFDREDALSKFPVIFKVIDGYDNPVNIKIVGNYIIAEDLSDRWTLKMGEEWVCVDKTQKPFIIKQKQDTQENTPQDKDIKSADSEVETAQKTSTKESNDNQAKESSIEDIEATIQKNKKHLEELEKLQSKKAK